MDRAGPIVGKVTAAVHLWIQGRVANVAVAEGLAPRVVGSAGQSREAEAGSFVTPIVKRRFRAVVAALGARRAFPTARHSGASGSNTKCVPF